MKKSMKKFQIDDKKARLNSNFKQQLPMNLQLKISAKYQIPPLIKKLYPRMTLSDFQNELSNDFFLNQAINICSDCYMKKMKKCRPFESQSGKVLGEHDLGSAESHDEGPGHEVPDGGVAALGGEAAAEGEASVAGVAAAEGRGGEEGGQEAAHERVALQAQEQVHEPGAAEQAAPRSGQQEGSH